MKQVSLLVGVIFVACAGACEMELTHAEIAADRARAVELFGPSFSRFGASVNSVGDTNGDGFDDFVLYETGNSQAGAIYVVFGRSAEAWKSAKFNFSEEADPANWIKIVGTSGSYLGKLGIAHGDFNSDGFSDFLISATNSGKAFVVYGHSGNWSSFCSTEIESGDVLGFAIIGGEVSMLVGNAGDMNGDGIDDLFVSDSFPTSEKHFVIFGKAGANRSVFNTSEVLIDGLNGFSLSDETASLGYCYAMGSAGDVNGDGLLDLAIGSNEFDNDAGRAYILFARNVTATGQQWPAFLNLSSDLDGTNGFIVEGPASAQLGFSVVGAGDVNADGFADVFIGSSSVGAWIIFGHPTPWISPLNVSQLDGSNGFFFAALGQNWGFSGGNAGDVNGDGIDDMVIGGSNAANSSGAISGAAIILFGHSGLWPAELNRGDAIGSVGLFVEGPAATSQFGYSARGAGDVNGDGLADFVVGAPQFSSKGYAVLVFGVADHCAVCSNSTDDCLVCRDGFFLNSSSVCDSCADAHCKACSSASVCIECNDGFFLSGTSCKAAEPVVVVIETGGGGSATEVAEEVAQLLGVDVGQISIIEITPGTFEVTIVNEEVAQQLVTLIDQCKDQA